MSSVKRKRGKEIMDITIRKREFKNWIYDNGFTQPRVARRLHIPLQEMKDKLTNHEPFTEEQIRNLVRLMGAVNAFRVMYFPTFKDRERIKEMAFPKRNELDEAQDYPAPTDGRNIT